MLENIIKTYLFESRRFKAVVKKADSKSFNAALEAFMHLMLYIQLNGVEIHYQLKKMLWIL